MPPRAPTDHGAEAPPERRAELAREPLANVFLDGEVDDVLGLDDLARYVVDASQAVGEAEIDSARAVPDEAREELGRLLQPFAASRFDRGDELLMDLVDHVLRVVSLLLRHGRERIEK